MCNKVKYLNLICCQILVMSCRETLTLGEGGTSLAAQTSAYKEHGDRNKVKIEQRNVLLIHQLLLLPCPVSMLGVGSCKYHFLN